MQDNHDDPDVVPPVQDGAWGPAGRIPVINPFISSTGPQGEAQNAETIQETFELFFSEDLLDTIVRETNRYADQVLSGDDNSRGRSPGSSGTKWRPVDRAELKKFLGLSMLTG